MCLVGPEHHDSTTVVMQLCNARAMTVHRYGSTRLGCACIGIHVQPPPILAEPSLPLAPCARMNAGFACLANTSLVVFRAAPKLNVTLRAAWWDPARRVWISKYRRWGELQPILGERAYGPAGLGDSRPIVFPYKPSRRSGASLPTRLCGHNHGIGFVGVCAQDAYTCKLGFARRFPL